MRHGGAHPGAAPAAFGVGLCCLVAAGVLALLPRQVVGDEGALPGDEGAVPAVTGTTAPPPPTRSPAPAAARPSTGPRRAPAPPTPRELAVPPRAVHIPHLRVRAPVEPVAVTRGGELAVPANPDRLGWWVGGAALGAARGTVLVAGHVDDVRSGPGALYRLERLPMGAVVEMDSADRRHSYRVVARRVYEKQSLPARLFDPAGPPLLALVTCGGAFTPERGYERNVVVYAEPAGPPRPLR